jgi:hypothetical protein
MPGHDDHAVGAAGRCPAVETGPVRLSLFFRLLAGVLPVPEQGFDPHPQAVCFARDFQIPDARSERRILGDQVRFVIDGVLRPAGGLGLQGGQAGLEHVGAHLVEALWRDVDLGRRGGDAEVVGGSAGNGAHAAFRIVGAIERVDQLGKIGASAHVVHSEGSAPGPPGYRL